MNTAPVVSPSIEYTIVFFALLLALTIVAGALWLEKRPSQTIKVNAVLLDPTQNEDAPNTDALIATAQEMDAPKTDALVMRAQEMDTGAIFRIRRTILLPSTPVVETTKSGESPTGSSLRRRSTGLLSRYGEIQQE